jgi:phosphoribosylformylglycinamidine synthase subunit PurSL
MAHQVEIKTKIKDTKAKVLRQSLRELGLPIQKLWLTDVYTLDKKFSKKALKKIALLLSNPVCQDYSIDKSFLPSKFSLAVEIGFLPGVTDNVGQTAKQAVEDLLGKKFLADESVYFSNRIYLKADLSKSQLKRLSQFLINPLIQRIKVKTMLQVLKNGGMDIVVPKVKLKAKVKVDRVNLNVSNSKLKDLGKKGIKNTDGSRRGPLALSFRYMKAIRAYFKTEARQPTDIELESLAQTWSEHCKHTIFNSPLDEFKKGLFNTFIKGATDKIRKKRGKKDICVSVFKDNSGAIVFNKDYLLTDKVETHNSPSALDPFGGAITGIVGVNRDTIGFGLGAKPVLNRYGFCLANPDDKSVLFKDEQTANKLPSAKQIMAGVVKGVNVGGNCSGIPTPLGFLYFDKSYRGKPLVFVGTVGLIPKKRGRKKLWQKKAQPGDLVVMIGGRVGKDGIHGATFSSEALNKNSPAGAVQIGDPITQKKFSDAVCKEARDKGLYSSITDNGAGGLSCSVAEMAKEAGGFEVVLEKVALKYPGLHPWETWISESQERMTLAVSEKKWTQFKNLMEKRGVEAAVIGRFISSGRAVVKYKDKVIMNLSLDFLHNGLPKKKLKTKPVIKNYKEPNIAKPKTLGSVLKQMLKQPNLTSFQFISQQYDHEVQAGSVLKPLQGRGLVNSEVVVTRPLLTSKKGTAVSQGLYPRYSLVDTYHMAACSIDTAVRNIISVGGSLEKLALLDNFCWCSSDEPQRLYQLKRAAQACYDTALFYATPFISGKDSMFNDFKGYDNKGKFLKISVLPTLLISSLGVIDDVYKTVSMDLKSAADLVYILGETFEELGGSEYFKFWGEKKDKNFIGNFVPKVNLKKNKKVYQALTKAINKNLIASSLSITKGGLGIALAKKTMAGGLGLKIALEKIPGSWQRPDYALFSESQGRLVVTINPKKKALFEKTMKETCFKQIGKVIKPKKLLITYKKKNKSKIKTLIDLKISSMLKAYKSTFKGC